jgi:hypothetical protein
MMKSIGTRCRPSRVLGLCLVALASTSCCKAWDGPKGDAGSAVFRPREDPVPPEVAGMDREISGNRKDLVYAGTAAP